VDHIEHAGVAIASPLPSYSSKPDISNGSGSVSAAAVTVLTILVITDLTTGTGRFNLVRGFVGTVIAIAASISTGITGFIFQGLGNWQGFLIPAAFAATATALLWSAMPQTRPTRYLDIAPCKGRLALKYLLVKRPKRKYTTRQTQFIEG